MGVAVPLNIVASNPGGTDTTLAVTVASHQEDDVLKIALAWKGVQNPTTPAGWNSYGISTTGNATSGLGMVVYWRRVNPSETVSNPTITIGGTAVERVAVSWVERGADIDNPGDTFWIRQQTVGNSATPTPPTITTIAPNYLIIEVVAARGNTAITEPSGYTEIADEAVGSTLALEVSHKTQAAAATLSGQSASITSNRWVACIIAVPSPDYPYFRSQTSQTATATSITGTLPTGTTAADFYGRKDLIIATVEAAGTAPSPNVGADWTSISTWETTTSGGATTIRQYWALYDGSISLQFNRTGSGEISLNLSVYRNPHQTAPIGNVNVRQNASSTTSTWDALTRSATKSTVAAMCVADGTPSYTAPGGWTEREDGFGMTCADQIFENTGSTASASFTLSTASPTAVGLVEILSHAGAAPDITLALTGVSSTASVGTLAHGISTALIGNQITGAVGTLGVSRALALTGVEATGSVGSLAIAGSFPTTSVLDNFNRANEGPPPSSNWTSTFVFGSGSFTVSSNQLAPTSSGQSSAYWNVADVGPDAEVYVTMPVFGATRLHLRLQDEDSVGLTFDGYSVLAYTDNNFYVYRNDDGLATQLGAAIPQTFANGDSFGARIVGDTITVYYKPVGGSWSVVDTRTDSTYTAAGRIAIETIGSTSMRLDDFGGGTLTSGATLALTGVSSTASAGSMGASAVVGLSGNAGTGSVGNVASSRSVAIAGLAATAGIGTLGVDRGTNVSGVSASVAVGNLEASRDLALTGAEATATPGTLVPDYQRSLSGVTSSSAVGSVTNSTAVLLTGNTATGAVGSMQIAGDSSITLALSGVSTTAAIGSLGQDRSITPSGVAAAGQVGSLAASRSIVISGNGAVTALGSLNTQTVVSINGSQATGATGALAVSESFALGGVQVSGAVGSVTAETSITISLSGVMATGSLGMLTAVAGPYVQTRITEVKTAIITREEVKTATRIIEEVRIA